MRTKKKAEQYLEISKKNWNDDFEYVYRLEGGLGKINQEALQAGKNRDNSLTKVQQTLTKI